MLVTFSQVAAPVLPFITEEMYQRLVPPIHPEAPASIHHSDYPTADPAVIDAPLGKGHVVLFAIHPAWRHITQGSYALLFNAMLHYDHLDAGRGKEPGAKTATGKSTKGDRKTGRDR